MFKMEKIQTAALNTENLTMAEVFVKESVSQHAFSGHPVMHTGNI